MKDHKGVEFFFNSPIGEEWWSNSHCYINWELVEAKIEEIVDLIIARRLY